MKSILLISFTLLATSCSMLPDRSFYEIMDPTMEPVAMFEPRDDFDVVSGDVDHGYKSISEAQDRTPPTAINRKRMLFNESLNNELYELEARQTPEQLSHYAKNEQLLESQSEKIYFLRLRTIEERNEYLISRGYIKANFNNNFREMAAYRGDVTLGMDKDQVRKIWGVPYRIDIAGNPSYENERWSYVREGETKFIFFESGRVEGWTTQ